MVPSASALNSAPPGVKPRLRGVSHQYAFFVAIACGIVLGLDASTTRERVAAAVFAATVTTMFGASALYNRVTWSARWRPWIRRLDHSMILLLIAGAYTPFGLLVLSGAWTWAVLAVVWTGVAVAIVLKFAWTDAPKWVAVALGVSLGWVGIAALPVALERIGPAGLALLLAGGVLYTAGGVVYATHRPDPMPAVFGYHEVFHALVILAAACQYAVVAFFVL
jgi:hemolysin III